MSVRSLAKVTNATKTDSAVATSLLKHSGVQSVKTEPKQSVAGWTKNNSEQKISFKQDFSSIPVSSHLAPLIQTKLVVGRPDDRYEQEADRIADQVMGMPSPTPLSGQDNSGRSQPVSIQKLKVGSFQKLQRQMEEAEESTDEEAVQAKFLPTLSIQSLSSTFGEQLQRQADELQEAKAEDQEEGTVQAKFLSSLPVHLFASSGDRLQRQVEEAPEAQVDDEEEQVQAKRIPQQMPSVTSDLTSRLKASRGGGQPLSASTREFMESRFNHDFSQVRVHTDGQANQLASDLNAQAFAWQQHIYFGAGYYQPHSRSGQRLIAHELTHTIQQQPHSLPKPHHPAPSQSVSSASQTISTPETKGADLETSALPISAMSSIAQAVPSGQTLISRRMAPPSVAKDKSQGDPGVEGPFAPPGAKTSEKAAAKPVGKTAPSVEEEPEEIVDQISAEGEVESAGTVPNSPEQEDPAFQAVVSKAKGVAKQQSSHATAKTEAGKAQGAAEPPKNEVESQAQDRQVQELDQQKPGVFNADAFVAAILDKVKEITPKTEDEAKEFKKNNKINSVKENVSTQVKDEKQKTTDPIANKNKEAPNTSGIEPKPVNPLDKPNVGSKPPDLNAAEAAPKPKPETEVSEPFKKNSEELDQQMSGAGVTEEQLEKSNEPQFTAALDAKKSSQADATAAPDAYRKDEQGVLSNAQNQAEGTAQAQTTAMFGQRGQLLVQAKDQQQDTKSKDEQERTAVANHIDGIYEKTKVAVENNLKALDDEVNKRFDAGALVAKQQFENYVDKEMDAYKERRYGAWYDVTGYGARIGDAFTGLPPEVNVIFVRGRSGYLDSMKATLKNIANYVADTLNKAKQLIANGKKEIQTYVASLKPSLKKVGQEAAEKIQEKFDQLEEQVNNKQNDLIDSLVEKYKENLSKIDEDIKKRQDDNKGLIDKAKDIVTGVIDTIRKLKEMIEKTLARIAEVAQLIIKDPIGFLGNLVDGLAQGFNGFVSHIGKHLKDGFVGWLTGTLGPMGIQIPDDIFSLKGIFSLVTQVLGLSWAYIREKAVKLMGEPVVEGLEKGAEIFMILIKDGPIGLWNYVKEQFTNLQETVMDQIKEMIISQVIDAGVKWVLGLLSPVGAFVKAVMAIVDIVRTLIERAAQIGEFVNSVIDAVASIAKGDVSGAAKMVEGALAKSIPLIIGFLASLIGVSGIAKKVQAVIQKIRQKIDNAIETLIKKIKKSKIFQVISKKIKGLVKKGKAAVKKIKKKVKSLVKKAKRKVKAFVGKIKKKFGIGKGNKSKTKQDKDKKKAERQHAKIGKAVVKAMSQKSSKDGTYEELRNQKEKQAKGLETKYNQQLEQPVKLKISFKEPDEDKKDADLDFHIHIGPNDFDMDGATEGGGIPPTTVTHELNSGRAAIVTAAPLTNKPGNTSGSPATANPLGWNIANWLNSNTKDPTQTTDAGKSRRVINWRRVHLLSHLLHGPGDQNWNLTPTTQPPNSLLAKHENKVYQEIKEGKTFYKLYQTNVEYNNPDNENKHPQAGTWNTNQFPSKITLIKQKTDEASPTTIPIGNNLPTPDPTGAPPTPDYYERGKTIILNYFAVTKSEDRQDWSTFSPNLNLNRDIKDAQFREQIRTKLRIYYNESKGQ
jgi:Domain of unknown function (DUF4157)